MPQIPIIRWSLDTDTRQFAGGVLGSLAVEINGEVVHAHTITYKDVPRQYIIDQLSREIGQHIARQIAQGLA